MMRSVPRTPSRRAGRYGHQRGMRRPPGPDGQKAWHRAPSAIPCSKKASSCAVHRENSRPRKDSRARVGSYLRRRPRRRPGIDHDRLLLGGEFDRLNVQAIRLSKPGPSTVSIFRSLKRPGGGRSTSTGRSARPTSERRRRGPVCHCAGSRGCRGRPGTPGHPR